MNRELYIHTLRMLRDQYHAEYLGTEAEALEAAISALEQPELIEQGAYVRGFEQGRTQGMLDAKLQQTCNQLATDTISRRAAIDAVRDRMGKGETNIGDTFIECFEMILNALASAQPEPQWISCKDRLPDKNQICIVTDDKMDITYEYGFHPETYDEVNGWTYLGHKIIAWMPLPEPYKEKDNEKA